ncbi:5' nucleotidase, NT5C type [Hungatella hathewayi]|uniref:5' nucleotidase, NT5C type n=1 Tax=Hungatella hathewayi TaxID=154046 RepID=UPI0035637A20
MKNYRYSAAIDVDDVLMPCVSLACEIANENNIFNPPLDVNEVKTWNLAGTRAEPLLAFFKDPEFYKRQVPYPGAQAFVKKLSKKVEIFIVTAIEPESINIRINQIKKYFPEINPKNIIPAYRKDVINVDFTLDDGAHNVLASNAKYPVLFRRPWNEHITGVLAINNYNEFLNVVDCVKESYAENSISFRKPTVITLVGPSGSGKTTLLNGLLQYEKIDRPMSATTRTPRDGNDYYHFISDAEFEKMKADQRFAETTVYAGEKYGTELASINEVLLSGRHCIMAIDISGAMALKMQYQTVIMYVKRDRMKLIDVMLQRLMDGTTTKEDIVNRIVSLDDEKKNEELCDYIIDNNSDVEDAITEIFSILKIK